MNRSFKLYSVELQSDSTQLLEAAIDQFTESAEIAYFNKKDGKTILQFVSTKNVDEVEIIVDELKKQVELGAEGRLRYKVTLTY